jgi:hypothetical protein
MPLSVEALVRQALEQLVGQPLADRARTLDMLTLGFGRLRPYEGRTVAELALHVQCSWRVDGPEGIVTGRADFWEPADDKVDRASWDNDRDPNLQDRRMAEWLGEGPSGSGPVVLAVRATPHGGAEIDLSDGCRLTLFPAGTVGEDWRLFRPGDDASHFVVRGGRVEGDA